MDNEINLEMIQAKEIYDLKKRFVQQAEEIRLLREVEHIRDRIEEAVCMADEDGDQIAAAYDLALEQARAALAEFDKAKDLSK